MSEDQQMPMTLTIDGSAIDLAVVNICGHEGLNEAYCFTVDPGTGSQTPDIPWVERAADSQPAVDRKRPGRHRLSIRSDGRYLSSAAHLRAA